MRTIDLLDLVPNQEPDLRSQAQTEYMEDLIKDLTKMDVHLGRQAREYTDNMTARGLWRSGYESNTNVWITRLLTKIGQLRVAARLVADEVELNDTEIPAGRYAVETDEIRCYEISYGCEGTKWEGFLFLDRISSDGRFQVKNRAEKARILAEISKDVAASAILAGLTLRRCRRAGTRGLDTSQSSL